MSSTRKASHRSIFSSLTSSSRSSINSSSSNSHSTPLGCRDFRLRYAKDAKGHDLTSAYPYSTPTSSSASSTRGSDAAFPVSSRDSLRLRYAKDSKGHDFTESYPAQFGKLAPEEELALLAATSALPLNIPVGARDYKRRVNRYAKDGKGLDFEASYKY